MMEKSHSTPTAIAGIWGAFPSREINTLALERKNAVGKNVNSKSGIEFSPLMIAAPVIPARAKAQAAPNKRTNRRTTQPRRDLPCAEITSNMGSVRVLHHSPITIAVHFKRLPTCARLDEQLPPKNPGLFHACRIVPERAGKIFRIICSNGLDNFQHYFSSISKRENTWIVADALIFVLTAPLPFRYNIPCA